MKNTKQISTLGLCIVSGIILGAFTYQNPNDLEKRKTHTAREINRIYQQEEEIKPPPPVVELPQVQIIPEVIEETIEVENIETPPIPDVTITIPSQEKTYFINDNTTGSFVVYMKTAAGAAVQVNPGSNIFLACDGTDIHKLESPTSVASFTVNSLAATSIATSVLDVSATASITTLTNTSITTSVVSATQLFAVSVATSVITGDSATFTGTVSAAYFDGDGSNLTNIGGSVTLTNASQFSSDGGAVTKNAVQSFAKAWCNFNGQGTPGFRDSFNGSSITDNGTGDYGFNMTSAMSNANYSSHATSAFDIHAQIGNGVGEVCAPNSTTKVEYGSGNTTGAYDQLINQCAVFGDLA